MITYFALHFTTGLRSILLSDTLRQDTTRFAKKLRRFPALAAAHPKSKSHILPAGHFPFTYYYIAQPLRHRSTFFINKLLGYQTSPL